MPRRLARRVLLLGWGGADWQVIHPLLDAGQMPFLAQIVNGGAMGNLAAVPPLVSPMLWTSIATGKRADEHGVHGCLELAPDGVGVRPPASTSLDARPLWQIAEAHGLRSAVVGWDATHPASAAGGVAVSDELARAQGDDIASWPLPPDAVAPLALREVMRGLRVHPADVVPEQLAYFVPALKARARVRDERLGRLRILLAEISTVHAAATWLAEHEEWDLLAVQYRQLDAVCREFGRFRPSTAGGDDGRSGAGDALDRATYGHVPDRFYQFLDAMLGRYMCLVGPDTCILIVSEHGLSQELPAAPDASVPPGRPCHVPRPYGIIAAHGPGIARDQLVFGASVLDVAPTVLGMLGLPIGRDMEGRVPPAMFVEPLETAYVDSHGAPATARPALAPEPSPETEEDDEDLQASEDAVRHLERLGYQRAPGEDAARELVRIEGMASLGEVQLQRGRWQRAGALFEAVLARRPGHVHAQLRLVQCRLKLGDVEGGRALAREFLGHDLDSPWAQLALGLIDAVEERWDSALERFARAQQGPEGWIDVHVQVGAVHVRRKQWAEAEAAFRRSLEVRGDDATAYHWLGLALHGQRRYAEAAESFMRSIGLDYHQPAVHCRLGVTLYGAGHVDAAVESLETALRFQPDLAEAHGMLARVRRDRGDLARAAEHEAARAALRAAAP